MLARHFCKPYASLLFCRPLDQDAEMAECSGKMSATQEACQAELELAEAMVRSSDADPAASAAVSDELPGRPLLEADWQEVVYKVSNALHAAHYYTSHCMVPAELAAPVLNRWMILETSAANAQFRNCICHAECPKINVV